MQHLDSEDLPTLFVDALAHYAMGALPYFLLHPEALLEGILPKTEFQLPLPLIQRVLRPDFHVMALVLGGASEIVNCLVVLDQSCNLLLLLAGLVLAGERDVIYRYFELSHLLFASLQ